MYPLRSLDVNAVNFCLRLMDGREAGRTLFCCDARNASTQEELGAVIIESKGEISNLSIKNSEYSSSKFSRFDFVIDSFTSTMKTAALDG